MPSNFVTNNLEAVDDGSEYALTLAGHAGNRSDDPDTMKPKVGAPPYKLHRGFAKKAMGYVLKVRAAPDITNALVIVRGFVIAVLYPASRAQALPFTGNPRDPGTWVHNTFREIMAIEHAHRVAPSDLEQLRKSLVTLHDSLSDTITERERGGYLARDVRRESAEAVRYLIQALVKKVS